MIITFKGKEYRYRLLNILEFTSSRKRMSVIVEDDKGNYILFCKGADSIIEKRLNLEASIHLSETKKHVDFFAEEGLRTLFLAKKKLSRSHYVQWNSLFEEALQKVANRDEEVARVNEMIENDLELIGSTAIEDKLQDDVAGTIRFIRQAGIKVWVLTGDKVETAINIGFSSGLLDNNMMQFMVTASEDEEIDSQLNNSLAQLAGITGMQKCALIVNGESLLKILNIDALKQKFLQVGERVNVVLACRVSPKQKADIVQVMRDRFPTKTTLSIGDGANDVNMITTAHVGVGISGLE